MEARKGAVRNVQICRKDRGEASLARASAQAARPSPEGVIGSMSRSVGKWIVFVDDGVFIAVILGGRHDADLSVYFEEGDRDHQGDSARISCRFGLDGTPCDLTAIRIGVYQTGLARADRDRRLPTPIFGKRNDASRHGLENSLVIRAMDHGTWIPGWRSERIGRTTWRDIVGDTGEWKEAHEDQVLAMVRPDRLDRAKDYAVEHGCDIFEALDEVRRSEKRWKYRRRPPDVPPSLQEDQGRSATRGGMSIRRCSIPRKVIFGTFRQDRRLPEQGADCTPKQNWQDLRLKSAGRAIIRPFQLGVLFDFFLDIRS